MTGAKGVLLIMALGATALWAQEPSYRNSIGMEFVLIEPGSMLVGKYEPNCPSPGGNAGRGGGRGGQAGPGARQGAPGGRGGQNPGAGRAARPPADPRNQWSEQDFADCEAMAKEAALPGFTVEIEKPYYVGTTEVTQGQWKKVMGANPSYSQGDRVTDDADQHPVDSVTWADAQAFVEKLNALEETDAYRLPTEFEWEYAARAGSDQDVDNYRDYSWTGERDKPVSHAVAGKKPNDWGLYDMIGNVWEWVEDYYNEKFFPDPVPPASGTEHVLRGASFIADVHNASAFTHGAGPGNGWDVSFRIVRDVE